MRMLRKGQCRVESPSGDCEAWQIGRGRDGERQERGPLTCSQRKRRCKSGDVKGSGSSIVVQRQSESCRIIPTTRHLSTPNITCTAERGRICLLTKWFNLVCGGEGLGFYPGLNQSTRDTVDISTLLAQRQVSESRVAARRVKVLKEECMWDPGNGYVSRDRKVQSGERDGIIEAEKPEK